MGRERRVFKRIPFTEQILVNNAILLKGIDISEGGLYVHTGRSFHAGSIVDVTLPINDKKITLKAQVQHNQPSVGMGLQFVDLTDVQKNMLRQFIKERTTRKTEVKTEKQKVLLIEENAVQRRIHKSKLMLDGFYVMEVNDGIEAIQRLEEEIPDLIVLDLFMEKMDGFKVLAILRESPQWKDIPVIVFSAKGTQDVMDKVIDAGAEEFLVKMMTSPAKLANTVKNVLEKKSE
jgi:CheY-like chemotaxis protein